MKKVKDFFWRLGCTVWILAYVVVGISAGVGANYLLSLPNWWPDNGLWQITIWGLSGIVGVFAFLTVCAMTFAAMIMLDPDYDNPGPFPLKPLDKRSGP